MKVPNMVLLLSYRAILAYLYLI